MLAQPTNANLLLNLWILMFTDIVVSFPKKPLLKDK
jgi:hypothetical protein